MFQNLKAKELDVIITRKEEKILLEEALQYTSLSRKKNPQILQPGSAFGKSRIMAH